MDSIAVKKDITAEAKQILSVAMKGFCKPARVKSAMELWIEGRTMEIRITDVNLYERFAELAMLDRKHDPWFKKRKPAAYAWCAISDEDGEWYKDFVGIEFMAELQFDHFRKQIITDVIPVRILKNGVHHGRSIHPKHVTIL